MTLSRFHQVYPRQRPDGAIYWLARMVEGGEDPAFIARRLVISLPRILVWQTRMHCFSLMRALIH